MTLGIALAIFFATALFFRIYGGDFVKIEQHFTSKFSDLTASSSWFTIWVLVYIIWALMRGYLIKHVFWYNETTDFIVVTGLFSAVPFWVENSLKRAQAHFQELLLNLLSKQHEMLETLTELTVSVKQTLDLAKERDEIFAAETEALYALVERMVQHYEGEVALDGREVEDPNSSNTEH